MIVIRKGLFETNSSSCHALVMSNNAEGRLPKTIDLSADTDIGDYTRIFVRNLDEEDTRIFVNWLYCKGVEEIRYNGNNKWINKFAEEYKDNYTDMGFPRQFYSHDGTTEGALINFLLGNYWEYVGRDEYMDVEDYESTYDIYNE